MCGIAGIASSRRQTPGELRDMVGGMLEAIEHRGPDGHGLFDAAEKHALCLGHRRLSILDIAGGAQPMATRDGRLVVTFNGEIYNFAELRAELQARGHVFVSDHSDTEVLLYGYREWGARLPDRLNGMWAFAIYDADRGVLFCSRDRFGKKPFYYTTQNGNFVFASELNAIQRCPGIQTGYSTRALKKFFAYGYIPAPLSYFEGVFKLPGGHSLTLDLKTLESRVEKYWDFAIETDPRYDGSGPKVEAALCEELRHLLEQAVRRRLVADVPLGVFLSGGIDSSAVTAFAARLAGAERLDTFSIGFEEPSFDESAYARRTAQHLKTRHSLEVLSIDRAAALLPEIAARLDEPIGDSSLLPTHLLCRFARRHVKVALGGDGSDELFAGYDPFRALRYAKLYETLVPRPVHAGIRMLMAHAPVSHRNMSADFRIKRTLRGLSFGRPFWLPVWMAPVDPLEINELFQEAQVSAGAALEDLYSEAIEQWDGCGSDSIVDRALQFYTKLYLQDDILAKVDRASMLVSLEVRCPFLDIDLVNFVRRVPPHWKVKNGQTKYILKKALEPLLPRDILYRTKKGFGVPIGRWFSDGSLPFDTSRELAPLSSGFAARKLAAHRGNQADERAFLWNYWLLGEMRSHRPAAAVLSA